MLELPTFYSLAMTECRLLIVDEIFSTLQPNFHRRIIASLLIYHYVHVIYSGELTFLGTTSPHLSSEYLPRHPLWDDAFSLGYFICSQVDLLILFLCSYIVWWEIQITTNIFKCRVNIYLSYIASEKAPFPPSLYIFTLESCSIPLPWVDFGPCTG